MHHRFDPLRLRRVVALVLVPLLALAASGCGKDDVAVTTTTTDDSGDEPFPPVSTPPSFEELLVRSVGVVRGRVSSVGEVAVIVIGEHLAGDGSLPDSGSIEVDPPPGVEDGVEGLWILGAGDPFEVLSGPPTIDEEGVERLLAGEPRVPAPPTADAIRALAEEADLIVFGRIDATARDAGTVEVEVVIEGDAPERVEITRAEARTWKLPTDAPTYGVLFLVADGDGWIAINDQRPSAYRVTPVEDALG